MKNYPMNGPSIKSQEHICWYWMYPTESLKLRREFENKHR